MCGPSPSSWPKPKFPVESVNIGRIIFFDIFFNSARKVRKNGIGPIKIREKKLLRDFRVDAHCLALFPSDGIQNEEEERQKRVHREIKIGIFFEIS